MKTTTVIKNHKMLPVARELRRKMTPQEKKLWYDFLRKYPVKFYKQRIIESFIVDFYCADARLVIELDGSQHYTEQGKAYDEERSQILNLYDLEVLRFTNLELDQQFDAVCDVCPVRYTLSVKALWLCQLSRGESQRISLIQQMLTVGCNRLPLWGSWREAPERAK